MKPLVVFFALLLLSLPISGPAFAQGGAAGGGAGGTGGVIGGAGGVAGGAMGGAAQGGQPNVTTGGIGGRSGSRHDDGCTCQAARGPAGALWLSLIALAGGAWRRQTRLVRTTSR